jgi:hypothetical protein
MPETLARNIAGIESYDLLIPAESVEPRESDVEHQSVATGAGYNKNSEIKEALPRGLMLAIDGGQHLSHLECDKWMVMVAVGVTVCDDGFGLVMAVVGNEPICNCGLAHGQAYAGRAYHPGDSG